jgi:hypothetical protein
MAAHKVAIAQASGDNVTALKKRQQQLDHSGQGSVFLGRPVL